MSADGCPCGQCGGRDDLGLPLDVLHPIASSAAVVRAHGARFCSPECAIAFAFFHYVRNGRLVPIKDEILAKFGDAVRAEQERRKR